MFRKRNKIIFHIFVSFFIDSLKYLDIVSSEIKDMPDTALSALFGLTLIETTLCEQGVKCKKSTLRIFYTVES